ncbi:uncharacterized mitochondrial protein AtMg00810-like [Nicotiana tomentosiformis]|uniref:uncharacterized mitochondrial protein AtMg00810-like n=1 Tax=Nicotiana tomentosiformis TaxID=4098 RepID=UPI000878419E|nr:uncharacterized mitochondrial protein AtMg00810-like [Nicotiana tomentosiformis]
MSPSKSSSPPSSRVSSLCSTSNSTDHVSITGSSTECCSNVLSSSAPIVLSSFAPTSLPTSTVSPPTSMPLAHSIHTRSKSGFTHPDYPRHVLYAGQSAICKSDTSMFIHRSSSGILILLLYIDDIILTGSHSSLLDHFISHFSRQFVMKDLGDLHYFLGVQAVRSFNGLHIPQQKYISDLLLKFHMHICKPVRTLITSFTSLSIMDGELLSDPNEYKSMVGTLKYLTMTRQDIAYAINIFSLFMYAPHTTHLHCVKRIFKYLHGTITYGLFLRASSSTSFILAYSDADWAGCLDSRRSTMGFAVFLSYNLISWRAKKQPTISKSSGEVEYRAIAYTVAETSWIRNILRDIRLYLRNPVHVLCDNVSSTYMYRNPVFHVRSKHINVNFHYVREKVAQGDLVVRYVPTRLQFANIFTKGLPSSQFSFLRDNPSVMSASPD